MGALVDPQDLSVFGRAGRQGREGLDTAGDRFLDGGEAIGPFRMSLRRAVLAIPRILDDADAAGDSHTLRWYLSGSRTAQAARFLDPIRAVV
jgi:hypothetical protein